MGKASRKKPAERAANRSTARPKNRSDQAGRPVYKSDPEEKWSPRKRTGPQCSAKRVNGLPCKNAPIKGGLVCSRHGGGAPQVRAKANQRLLDMVIPSLARLRKIIINPATSDADAIRAVREVLNRTGFTERFAVEVAPSDKWAELLNSAADFADDRALGPSDPVAELEQRAYAVEQLARDANDKAWSDLDREDAEAFEAGRIRPDENTIQGEVVPTPRPSADFGRHPLDFRDRQPHAGASEFDDTKPGEGKTRIEEMQERLMEQDRERRRHR